MEEVEVKGRREEEEEEEKRGFSIEPTSFTAVLARRRRSKCETVVFPPLSTFSNLGT